MKIVIALGGNALVKKGQKGTLEDQKRNFQAPAKIISSLSKKHRIFLIHGNGFQVGQLLLQNHSAGIQMPLYECVKETQKSIGRLIQEVLWERKTKAKTILTQVLVNKKDPAFRNPSKPIGPAYKTKPHQQGKFVKTAKGWRKVVASPKPKKILELKRILSCRGIPISCGGGGIPVTKSKKGYQGIDAVIDKDRASSLLAQKVKANIFVILTDVPGVYLNYKTKNQVLLKKANTKILRKYLKEGQFPAGSMGPKIQACIDFIQKGGKKVVICNLDSLEKALLGQKGTIITRG